MADNTYTYTLSFLVGGLYYQESLLIAKLYTEIKDWGVVRKHVLDENLLQTRMKSSSTRMVSEIVHKLKQLSDREIEFLMSANVHDQKLLLWASTCRRYSFIRDFVVEVVVFRYTNLKTTVTIDEFEIFYHQKSQTHPELEKITEQTKGKLKSVMFKTMREAGLIDKKGTITPVFPSNSFIYLLKETSPEDLRIFPAPIFFGGAK